MGARDLTLTQDFAGFEAIIQLVTDGLGSPHSRRAYRRALLDFGQWYADHGRPGLKKSVVQAYVQELLDRGLSPATINQRIAAIRKLASEAADNNMLSPTLAAGIGRVKGVRGSSLPAGRALSEGEIRAMFAACADDPTPAGARDAALLALLRLGLRRAEVAGLELADYAADEQQLRILGKGRKERGVALYNGAAAAVSDWLALRGAWPGSLLCQVNKGGRVLRRGLSPSAVRDAMLKRARQAGVSCVTPHDFRRTFAGDLLDAGADLAVVSQLMGHSSPLTTSRYDRRPEAARRKAVGLLHVPYVRRAAP